MTKAQKELQKQAVEDLKTFLKKGDTVYTILKGVSSTGMSRVIDVVIVDDGKIRNIGYTVSKALGYGYNDKKGGLKVSGCGMDMGYHVVSSLAGVLFGYISPQDTSEPYTNCYGFNHKWL